MLSQCEDPRVLDAAVVRMSLAEKESPCVVLAVHRKRVVVAKLLLAVTAAFAFVGDAMAGNGITKPLTDTEKRICQRFAASRGGDRGKDYVAINRVVSRFESYRRVLGRVDSGDTENANAVEKFMVYAYETNRPVNKKVFDSVREFSGDGATLSEREFVQLLGTPDSRVCGRSYVCLIYVLRATDSGRSWAHAVFVDDKLLIFTGIASTVFSSTD